MTAAEKLDIISNIYHFESKSAFAGRLGISYPNLNNWYSRNRLDAEIVLKAFPEISAEWLMRGFGSPVRRTVTPASEVPDVVPDCEYIHRLGDMAYLYEFLPAYIYYRSVDGYRIFTPIITMGENGPSRYVFLLAESYETHVDLQSYIIKVEADTLLKCIRTAIMSVSPYIGRDTTGDYMWMGNDASITPDPKGEQGQISCQRPISKLY